MTYRWMLNALFFVAILLPLTGVQCEALSAWNSPVQFGGMGGVYLLAEPGELWVEIEKQDLNRSGRNTHLRAILFGPNRSVLDEQWLADDGMGKGEGPGPVQRLRLKCNVERKGVYGVNITVMEDRYGEHVAWGFRTNCPHYLVETSRGHKDADHEEPLVLLSPDTAGEVCFMPRRDSFAVDVTGLSKTDTPLTLTDSSGAVIATLPVNDEGNALADIAADIHRDAIPWRLHLPAFKGVVQIDGVTRWSEDDEYPDLSLWTPDADSWFAFHEYRWLLTPYSRTVYGKKDEDKTVSFQVHNNSLTEKKILLALEFPVDSFWPVTLAESEMTLKAGTSQSVTLQFQIPESGGVCYLRVTPADSPEFTTYATLDARCGSASANHALKMPLEPKAYRHENELFGYLPEYPLDNQVYFDSAGNPAIASDKGVAAYLDHDWQYTNLATLPDGKSASFDPATSKLAYDSQGSMYLLAHCGGQPAYLCSNDKGASFQATPFTGNGGFDIEQFSGHNTPDSPPPFVRYTLTKKDPKIFWRRENDLHLFLPKRNADGVVEVGPPILLTKEGIGCSSHSGIPSTVVSRGDKVHVVWGEATEPEEEASGVPAYVVTYDRATATLGNPALVGYGPPANDVHNTPCITMDSKGYLHVLVGTHGRTFKYTQSLAPNDASGGWTEAEDIGPGLRQTYIGLVCGNDDTLHVVFRLWRSDTEYYPASLFATLAYMKKPPNEPWSEPEYLIVAPFSEYSVFYHRLTIDRKGQLFLSYDYWSTFWFYRNDHWGTRRALMTSPDSGATWHLAGLTDLLP